MDIAPQSGNLRTGRTEADSQAQLYTSYGTACLNCVKSKTRCALSTTGGKCERCHRLDKDCQPAPTVRKRRVLKRPASSTSAEKLDGISHNGGNVQGNFGSRDFSVANNPPSMTSGWPVKFPQELRPIDRWKVGQPTATRYPPDGTPTLKNSTKSISTDPGRPEIDAEYPLETQAELEECLETYRTKMVPYFPVLCIDTETTMGELIKERPFLHLVIRTICSKNLQRQAVLVLQVKEVLGREVLLGGKKNLDLFLGVLVFEAWSHLYIYNKPINSTVIQLGISLAFDLGLTRPLSGNPVNPMLNYISQGRPTPVNGTTLARTIEERRAVVGLYLISSIFANCFRRIELMRWTPYLEECLRLLEEKKDYPTDDLLVHLVRVQLICNKGVDSTWNDIFGNAKMPIPADFYVRILTSQLDDFERCIPLGLKPNVTLQLHILSTTLSIHEQSLNATPTSPNPETQLRRVENLWICLKTVKAWFNSFFSLESFPLSCYPYISIAIFSQLAQCLVALYRLTTFAAPGILWDRQRVIQELDIADVIKLIGDRWERVPLAAGLETRPLQVGVREDDRWPEDPWSHTKRKVLAIGMWWEAKVAAMTGADVESENGPRSEGDRATNEPEISGQQQMDAEFRAMDMELLDDSWLRDLFVGEYDFNMAPYSEVIQ